MLSISLAALDGGDGFRLNGLATRDFSGTAVAGAVDVNGDGFADVLIGAEGRLVVGPQYFRDAGESYVIFGKAGGFDADFDLSDLDGSDGVRLQGSDVDQASGLDVAGVGDVNGDGLDDFLIGAGTADPNGVTNAGSAFVVFGDGGLPATDVLESLDGTDGFRVDGFQSIGFLGRAAAAAGDVNGDGVGDFIVGAESVNVGGATANGESYVVFGRTGGFPSALDVSDLDGSNGFRLPGEETGDESGNDVSGVGDFNGDGLADVLVGAREADAGFSLGRAGKAYLVFGRETGFPASVPLSELDGSDGVVFVGAGAFNEAGHSVSGVGDVNGDGLSDLAIGARIADPDDGDDEGSVFVVFGSVGALPDSFDLGALNGSNGFRLNGAAADDYAGQSVSGAGDVNGDGFDDLLIGANGVDVGGAADAGAAYVIFGGRSFGAEIDLGALDASEGFRLDGVAAGDGAGYAVAAAGDVNGDGFDDVVLGARLADPAGVESAGESYVVFGFDSGAITHQGTSGVDRVIGNGQANVMVLGAGADTFNAGNGDDVVRGGAGRDAGSLGGGDDLGIGGSGDDVLNGGLGDDVLRGGDGADRLILGFGADAAFGGAGTDLFFERANQLKAGDRLDGGEGVNDSLIVLSSGVLDLTLLDAFVGIERVRVAANQRITSTDDDLNWTGRSGAEFYGLGDGRDIVRAGGGGDVILGAGGDDTLLAQGGDDRIEGGAGTDRIVGAGGVDTFVLSPGMQIDIVFDYEDGVDLFDVSAFGFGDFDADIAPHVRTINGKAVVDLAAGDRLVLAGVAAADLDETDFILALTF